MEQIVRNKKYYVKQLNSSTFFSEGLIKLSRL